VLLPVHPLQADWLSHQDHVRRLVASGALREIGPLGPRYTATSSVRTVYSPGSPWMLKLSIPVKITNSLRFNQQHEMLAGVAMAAVTEELEIATRYPGFRVIADPACITVLSPGRRESGFEVILRTNPFMAGRDTGVHCLAAIVQEPMPHRASRLRALIEGLALAEGRSVQDVCLEWFARYFECAVAPLIRLYDEHGIALEAHQQNSLLDLSAGYPQRYFYRDNQGYYISRAERTTLMERVPELRRLPELFYEDALIRERLSYYLVANQLFSVVHRFGSDGLLAEERLLSFIAGRLMESSRVLGARGREFVRGLLEERRLAYKANLLTRLHDLDELTAPLQRPLYTTIDNPLCLPGAHVSEARDVA
jgi:spermidine-citrate ligase